MRCKNVAKAFLLMAMIVEMFAHPHDLEDHTSCYQCITCSNGTDAETVFNAAFGNLLTTDGYAPWYDTWPFPMYSQRCPDTGNPGVMTLSMPGTNCISMYFNAFADDDVDGHKNVLLSCVVLSAVETLIPAYGDSNMSLGAYENALEGITATGLESDLKMAPSSSNLVSYVTTEVTLCRDSINCNDIPLLDLATISFIVGTYSEDMSSAGICDSGGGGGGGGGSSTDDITAAIADLCDQMLSRLEGTLSCKLVAIQSVRTPGKRSRRRRSAGMSAQAVVEIEANPGSGYNSDQYEEIFVAARAALASGEHALVIAEFGTEARVGIERGGYESGSPNKVSASCAFLILVACSMINQVL